MEIFHEQKLNHVQQPNVHFIRDAVYVFAHALHNLWLNTCGQNYSGLCEGFHRRSYTLLKDYLHNVTFNDVDGFPFQFGEFGDGPQRYSIISYIETESGPSYPSIQPAPTSYLNVGVYNWKEVGTYQNGKIRNLDPTFNASVRNKNAQEHFVTCKRGACQADQVKIPEG